MTCCSEGGANQLVDAGFFVGVWKYHGVVLRRQVGLHPLAVGATPLVDIATSLVGTHKTDGPDVGTVADEVDGIAGAVDDLELK